MSEPRIRLRSTKRLVALCAVLTLVPLALLAFLSIRLATRAVEDNAKKQVRSNAAMTVNTFQSAMANVTQNLASFAARPGVQAVSADPRASRTELQTLLTQLAKTQAGSAMVFLVSRDGQVRAGVPAAAVRAGSDVSRDGWYQKVTQTGKPYISAAYRSTAAGHPNVLAVAVPVQAPERGGAARITGVLVATFGLSSSQSFVDYFAKSLGIDITLTDQNGVLLASPGRKPGKLVSLAGDPAIAAALQGQSGVTTRQSQQGSLLSAYAPIPGIGWTVAASVPKKTAFAAVDQLRSTVLAVSGVLAVVLLAALALLARSLRQRELAETTTRRLRVEAERARTDAEQANQAKSEFLSRMSHELRTPLNAVLGFGQLLAMGELDEAEGESVDQILKGGQHLLALINEVLDISRIEAGRLQLSLEPVELGDTVGEVLDLVRPLAAERAITITVDRPDGESYVVADKQRLSQVLLNLLSNAIKYNRAAGSARVAIVTRPDGRTRIEVVDTGEGISDEGLEKLFIPFERLGADVQQIEGTGLGLTLSRGLVEAMGGHMGVESEPGHGSTFWIELETTQSPFARIDHDPKPTQASIDFASGEHRYTILYIEDNLSNLKLVQRILAERSDINLIAAMQGRLGLELAAEHRPDLVLLDLHLPDIPGDEVMSRLKADPSFNGTPVVILSADATTGRIERLLGEGASAYLAKPIDVQQFLEVIAEHAPASVTSLR